MNKPSKRKSSIISYNCPTSDMKRLCRDFEENGYFVKGDDMLVKVFEHPDEKEVVWFLQMHPNQWVLHAIDGILSAA